jgi:hypothetical protein
MSLDRLTCEGSVVEDSTSDRGSGSIEAVVALPPGPELALALSRIHLGELSAHDLVIVV